MPFVKNCPVMVGVEAAVNERIFDLSADAGVPGVPGKSGGQGEAVT